MMWGYGEVNWWWMAPLMILFWGALIAVVVLTVRWGMRPAKDADQAMDALRARFASGAIDGDEFEKGKRILHG